MSDNGPFCSDCGTPNEGDALFCKSCGHQLDDTRAAPMAAPPVAAAATPQHGDRRRLSPNLIALFAVIIIGGGALAFFRAPLGSFLSSIRGSVTDSPDSLQLLPVTQDVQLNDRPINEQPAVVAAAMMPPVHPQAPVVQPVSPRTPNTPPRGPRLKGIRAATPRQPEVQPSTSLSAKSTPFSGGFEPPPIRFPEVMTKSGSPADASADWNRGSTGISPAIAATTAMGEPAPRRAAGRIAAGSVLSLRSVDQVCTDKTSEGTRFRGVVQQDIAGSDGAIVPKGTFVTFVVDHLKRAGGPNEKPEFSVAAESIELNGRRSPLIATVNAIAIRPKSRGLLGALAGAAAAAAVTRAAGGDAKETVAGGIVGGAAGAVVGSQLKTGDGCVEKNAAIRITLGADLTAGGM